MIHKMGGRSEWLLLFNKHPISTIEGNVLLYELLEMHVCIENLVTGLRNKVWPFTITERYLSIYRRMDSCSCLVFHVHSCLNRRFVE